MSGAVDLKRPGTSIVLGWSRFGASTSRRTTFRGKVKSPSSPSLIGPEALMAAWAYSRDDALNFRDGVYDAFDIILVKNAALRVPTSIVKFSVFFLCLMNAL